MSVRVALVGAGVVGRMRARTVARGPRASLQAVVDVDRARAEEAAAGTGARVGTEWRAVTEARDVDAVIVSTPAHLHEEAVVASLGAGKHVLCEKPLATTVDACRRIVDAAERAGTRLAVGFNHRYYPCFAFVKRVLDEGRLGELDHVRVWGGHEGLGEFRADWMYRSELSGGGAMMDLGIHLTDLVRFLAGDIRTVWGRTTNRVWEVPGSEDNAMAYFETATGVPVVYQATWSEWKGYRLGVDVYGRAGMVRGYYAPLFNLLAVRSPDGKRRRSARLYPWLNARERLLGWERTAEDAFAAELSDFVDAIGGARAEAGSLADGAAGVRAVEIANAVYESSRTGLPVKLA